MKNDLGKDYFKLKILENQDFSEHINDKDVLTTRKVSSYIDNFLDEEYKESPNVHSRLK